METTRTCPVCSETVPAQAGVVHLALGQVLHHGACVVTFVTSGLVDEATGNQVVVLPAQEKVVPWGGLLPALAVEDAE